MKKLFTLTILALLMAVNASAQDKKTWDFTKGVSEQTIANLTADNNWTVTNNDDGSFKQANEATKLSGKFIANDEPIKELEGLELGTAGLSKNNNVIIFPSRFRINRDKMEIIFPSLTNGQTITIVGRSANSTAENRGIKASYDYMERIEGPEDNLIRASLGEVKNVWKIVTSDSNPVEVKFTMITGGVDFTLFMIDDGDVAKVAKVAYLYDGTDDEVLNILKARENTEVTAVNVTAASVTADELRSYDVTVIGASVPADNAAVAVVKDAMPFTPTLNLNAGMYSAWTYGAAVETLGFAKIKSTKNALFENVSYEVADEGNVLVLATGMEDVPTQALALGDYFDGDDILATTLSDEPAVMIHSHNINHNGYMYFPYVPNYSAPAVQAISNAIGILADSKQDITAAAAPVISQEFKDMKTIVTLAPSRQQPKTRLFYTVDGTAPTVSSTEYTEPFTLTEACTVKAIAIAEGYTESSVSSLDIAIHSQPKTPTMSAVSEDGKTTITVDCETADVQIWYNFESEATTDTTKSTKYDEPFIITMPQNVNIFAVAGKAVWSEVASQRILVKNPRVVIDVAAHFQAPQWTADNNSAGLAVANGKGMFSWGASATTMYTGEGTSETTIDPETGDEITVVHHTPEDIREQEVVNEPGENPQWVLKSFGTCLIWQSLGAQTTNIGSNDNYNPVASTDIDPLFPVSKNNIQFYKFQADEPGNGSIETLNKYQAPLDVVVLANMAGGPLLAQVSADGVNWTTIGEIAKTGYSRMWGKATLSYNGTDEVYVRITQTEISAGAKVFDIYVANQGEKSQELLAQLNEELTGIASVKSSAKIAAGIYSVNGIRQNGLKTGLNIVVEADGTVKKIVKK